MLYGVLTMPGRASQRGILIVVGGPQYRAGSHRQFTLLARSLAAQGTAVMRFDYRGMGDSEGDARTFEDVDDDIRHAIDQFQAHIPELREVVIWGLCDAASAASFYSHRDPRVTGLVLLNPWVRTEQSVAATYLKHYYARQLFSRQLWSKIIRFRFDYIGSARSLLGFVGAALPTSAARSNAGRARGTATKAASLPERMLDGLRQFRGRILIILSGNDLTAKEFSDLTEASPEWRRLLDSSRVQRRVLPQANHTFSQRDWRDQVTEWTKDWIGSW
jgi:exosortase A-associated hydrolase 1